jgi:predicted HTH domain antitoxin
MSKAIQVSDELAQLLGPDERLPQAFIEAVVLELFRECRISAGKASEFLGLSSREFLDLLHTKNVPVVTTPPRGPHEEGIGQYVTMLETP